MGEPAQDLLPDGAGVGAGRELHEDVGRLAAEGLGGELLREGEVPRGSGRCASTGAAAFTAGGAAVFVCGTSFRTLARGARANALIHEMLHTLGLRENPPSSAEITRRVQDQAKIATNAGPSFGSGGEGFLRFNVATPRSRVAEAVARLQAAFADLQ